MKFIIDSIVYDTTEGEFITKYSNETGDACLYKFENEIFIAVLTSFTTRTSKAITLTKKQVKALLNNQHEAYVKAFGRKEKSK